jgi:hypothetical protein
MLRLPGLIAPSSGLCLHQDNDLGSHREAQIAQRTAHDDCGRLCFLIALLIAVVPVLTGFLGFYLNHRWESARQETQRAHDRRERVRETRRATLVVLQRALAGVRDGSETAALLLYADRATGVELACNALNEPWWKAWTAAAREVSLLTAQLRHQELIGLSHSVGVELHEVFESRGDEPRLRAAINELRGTYEQANELAGQLIQELDAEDPVNLHLPRPR